MKSLISTLTNGKQDPSLSIIEHISFEEFIKSDRVENTEINISIPIICLKMGMNDELIIEMVRQQLESLLKAKCSIKKISVEHIYVFQTGFTGNLGVLCFRKQEDAPNFYRGGMRFPMEDINTEEKVIDNFLLYKDRLSIMNGSYIGNNKQLVLEFMNVEVLT